VCRKQYDFTCMQGKFCYNRDMSKKGNPKPKGFGQKIRQARFNHPMPKYWGALHHEWKGGGESWRGFAWRIARRTALERDHYRCTECGRAERLQVHHLRDKSATGGNWDNSIENLRTVCVGCHLRTHRPSIFNLPCPICGKSHPSKGPNACCSDECRRESKRRARATWQREHSVERICQQCNRPFLTWKSHPFCSRTCSDKGRRARGIP